MKFVCFSTKYVLIIMSYCAGHQDDSSSSPARLPGRPTSASTWPTLALRGNLHPATPPPSKPCPRAYPMLSSWMRTPWTRMPAGCPSHGASRIDLGVKTGVLGDEGWPEWRWEVRRMGWWWPSRGSAVGNHVLDLP
jgi:hypothetical protein